MNKNKILQWLPGVISLGLAAITAVTHTFITDKIEALTYFQIFGAALIPFILPVWGLISKKKLPPALGFLLTFHVFLTIDLGNAMNFYDLIPVWDMILHGFFGFVGCVTASVFMIRWNGEKMNKAGFLLIAAVFTMGCGALWEIFEYACDRIMDTDIQRVQDSIAAGKSPLADTMEDMIITLAGIALFYAALLIDKLTGRKASKLFYDNTEKVEHGNYEAADVPPKKSPDDRSTKNDRNKV